MTANSAPTSPQHENWRLVLAGARFGGKISEIPSPILKLSIKTGERRAWKLASKFTNFQGFCCFLVLFQWNFLLFDPFPAMACAAYMIFRRAPSVPISQPKLQLYSTKIEGNHETGGASNGWPWQECCRAFRHSARKSTAFPSQMNKITPLFYLLGIAPHNTYIFIRNICRIQLHRSFCCPRYTKEYRCKMAQLRCCHNDVTCILRLSLSRQA